MAVYYKFKSAKIYDSILITEPYISIANLKERIFSSKKLWGGKDFDLLVSNAQSNEEYVDEKAMIPRNTSVLIRRVPGLPLKTIVAEPKKMEVLEDSSQDHSALNSTLLDQSSSMKLYEQSTFDDFGEDMFAIPEVASEQTKNPVLNISTVDKAEEDMKINTLVNTPAIDWQCQTMDTSGSGRGFQQFPTATQHGIGRGGLQSKRPPPGYVCHRCKVPGHFIQHCPTNGDPAFDIKRMKAPTGIPQSMLTAHPDGSYTLSSGAVAVLTPNEAAFDKEIEGLPTSCSISDLPVELCCPLCKSVMRDAVLTSKCCFSSFCDKCIRDYLISKSMCLCGATNMLADDLIPNKTLRETIDHMLVSRSISKSSSSDNAGSRSQVQDAKSTSHVEPKNASPTLSAASKEELKRSPVEISTSNKGDGEITTESSHAKQSQKKAAEHVDLLEASSQPRSRKESTLQQSGPTPGVVQGKVLCSEQVKRKKKGRTSLDGNVVNMLSAGFPDSGAESCAGHPLLPAFYNPYWPGGGMPGSIDSYMSQFMGNMPYMGYLPGAFDVWSQFGAQMNLPVPQRESSFDNGKITRQVMRSRSEASQAKLKLGVTTQTATTESKQSNQVERLKNSCCDSTQGFSKQNAAAYKDLDVSTWSRRRERSPDLRLKSSMSLRARASPDSSVKRDKDCNKRKRDINYSVRLNRHEATPNEQWKAGNRKASYSDSGEGDERHFKRRW
ncbi:E3 ubiquitin ligase PQT3-like isoform X2 [Typha angustifolia]|uniref:E3 ubiquitin ligase PQT3-like isoform X2 n=1 Tax=Typha angustifolia TaxID=59011 RepID=UPI003C2EB8D9